MASRRLDISSLLCTDDDQPPVAEPVVLAPHLRSSRVHDAREHEEQRDLVPLTLQPLHMRRRTPSPEVPQPSSSRHNGYMEYHHHSELEMEHPRSSYTTVQPYDQHRQRQMDPIHQQQRQNYQSPFEPQYSSLSRPSSSSHSPPLSHSPTTSYFYAQQSQQMVISPTHSPASLYGPGRPPTSTSPAITTQRGPSSPLSYFPAAPSSRIQLPRPTSSHSISPLQTHPHTLPSLSPHSHSPPMHHLPSAHSHPHTYRPTMSLTLPAPTPSISRPPTHSPTLQKPYAGLEALVHAASEERRRLSGSSIEATSPSPAPLHARHGADEYSQPHPREHHRVHVIQGYSPHAGDERPSKRRRSSGSQSGSYNDRRHVQEIERRGGMAGEPYQRMEEDMPQRQAELSRHLEYERASHLGPHHMPPHDDSNRYARPASVEIHHLGILSHPKMEDDTMRDSGRLSTDVKPEVKERKHSKSSSQSSLRASRPLEEGGKYAADGEPRKKHEGDRGRDEQDAHEWLLEHYAESPPTTRSPSIQAHLRATTSSHSSTSQRPTDAPEPDADPISALEHELEEVAGVIPRTAKPEHEHESDLALEHNTGRSGSRVGVEDVDVEDELLSLVDDRPRSSAASNRKHDIQPPSKPASGSYPSPSAPSVSAQFLHAARPSASGSPSLPPVATPERGSMPPPASTTVNPSASARTKDTVPKKGATSTVAGNKKKKDGTAKPAPKPKAPPKPRAKAATKAKAKDDVKGAKASPVPAPFPTTASRKSASTSAAAARSRSTSAMPGTRGSVAPEDSKMDVDKDGEAEADDKDRDDDKLYCVCKTRYDEDRVMIACDRCDEWYHTQCVNMPDLEVDLVDQFICPVCIESNQHLSLRTTYKRRCLYGLKQPDPSSSDACHKPARGAFSKYCSDECGVKYMQSRIDAWSKDGGKKEKLWESVKGAEKREGVVVCAVKDEGETNGVVKMEVDKDPVPAKPKKSKVEREVERFNAQLDRIVKDREGRKKELEVILWRERLTELATERAERVDECGWDQRLCFGDEEWADFGAGVLESYEESSRAPSVQQDEGEDAMQVDGAAADGEWWCRGKKKCERHFGWQKLRAAEVSFEKEMKDSALSKLTTREREIRKRIEDIIDPQAQTRVSTPPKMPLASSNVAPNANGHTHNAKLSVNGEVKKGKKRKSQIA